MARRAQLGWANCFIYLIQLDNIYVYRILHTSSAIEESCRKESKLSIVCSGSWASSGSNSVVRFRPKQGNVNYKCLLDLTITSGLAALIARTRQSVLRAGRDSVRFGLDRLVVLIVGSHSRLSLVVVRSL